MLASTGGMNTDKLTSQPDVRSSTDRKRLVLSKNGKGTEEIDEKKELNLSDQDD